jgi:polysaccharide export outer membrane protein
MKNLQPTFRGGILPFTLLLFLVAWTHQASAGDYVIGPRDTLKITVWGQPDLSQNYNVSVEGTIVFPLIGEVRATGLTEAQLGQKLVNLLEKDYLVNPQVLVSVAEYKSKKVLVLGEAVKPGVYPLTGNTTVLEVISNAGGFGTAYGKQLVLVRPVQRVANAGGTVPVGNTIRRLNIEKIQAGDTSENVEVEDGDTLFIPKANAFFVLGEVSRPGSFTLDKETTILEAVTFAGGFANKASPSGTKVIRKRPEGGQETIAVDLSGAVPANKDFVIRDGDTVLVPRGNTFFVFGEVKRPGDFLLEKNTTILEAISVAGGFTDKAAPGRTKIIRNTPTGGQQTIEVDMNDIIKRGRRDKAVPLQEGDVIVVPEAYF